MSLVLYGTLASPFVRRIRMQLDGVDYQLEEVDILQSENRSHYAHITPIRKMPVLDDSEQRIYDSHVICQYLRQKLALPPLSVTQHNQISVIDAITDSMVILLMAKRSELPVDEPRLMFTLQQERIADCLDCLEHQAEEGLFSDWDYPAMALVSLIDWARFRGLHEFSAYPALRAAVQAHSERPVVAQTRPH